MLLPSSVGIPLDVDARLGLVAAWSNTTNADVEDVWLRVVFRFTPSRMVPAPIAVLPVGFDVGYAVGTTDAYDLPPGHSIKAREFIMPINARILAVSGHLHRHGVAVRLEDVESGRVLVDLRPVKTVEGAIEQMPVRLLGIRGEGLRLRAGRRYRVVGEYDNTSDVTIPGGAMAVMATLVRPDCLQCWPAIEDSDPHFARDLATLPGAGWAGTNWLEPSSTD